MKEKILKLKYLPHTMAFVIPLAIVLGICIGIGIYPFGEMSLLHMDAYHQYGPFFMDFARKLKEGGSLMYSWNLGLGSDYVSLYAYYLASPWNWLLYFVPMKYVIEFMDLTVLLKIAFCGFNFFLFEIGHFQLKGKDGRFHQRTLLPALACSSAYALCGFVAAYSWDIMWMDSVALAPLVFLGIDRLMQQKNAKLYYFALAIAIFSNYYISIMICIFAVFYFFAMLLEQKKERLQAIFRFGWYSLLAGGTSAILILPEIAVLGASGSSTKGFPEKMEWYFDTMSTIARGCMTATCYKGNDHWPNLYSGTFVFLVVFLYALNRRIPLRKKITRLAMVVFFVMSFRNNYLDFLWHGFHFPQALPGRQSFLFSFLLLCMTFEVCRYIKHMKYWHILVAFLGSGLLLGLGYRASDFEITESYAFFATLGFVFCYAILMILIRFATNRFKKILGAFAFCIVLTELTVNMAITGLCSSNRRLYLDKMESYQVLLMEAQKASENTFYRVEDTQRKTKNDDSLYGYPSATIFSSLMNLEVSHLYQAVYMEGGLNYYCYNGATPLLSGMLTVKYMLSDSPYEESALRTQVAQFNGHYLYENNYYIPLGFMMSQEQIEEFSIDRELGKIQKLNSLSQALTEESMIYDVSGTVDLDVESGSTRMQVSQDGYYYAAHKGCTASSLYFKNVRSGYRKTFGKTTHTYLLELGYCEAGDELLLTNHNSSEVDLRIYKLNMDVVDEAYAKLMQQTMILDEQTDTRIKGHITVKEDGNLIFSIPADEGWTVYVDGKKTEIEPFKKALISIPLHPGKHEIELKYQTPHLVTGAVVSILCIALFAGSCLLVSKRKNTWKENE